MAGIYFIISKIGGQGYIGLDSDMTASNFPRLIDHVAAAYGIYGRDIYRGSYKLASVGSLRKNIQHCEKIMKEQCCSNFDYRVILKENNCFGLGSDNYTEFCKTWISSYKEPEMSWAEVYYVYQYNDMYAGLNEAWGGAGKFHFNINALKDIPIGNTSLRKLAEDAKITWYPDRNKKTIEHMYDLFFPYAKVFNTVITYYINTFIVPGITTTLFEQLATRELWDLNSTNIQINVADIIKEHWQLDSIAEAIIESAPKEDYIFPDIYHLKQEVIKTLNNLIAGVVKTIKETIKNTYTKTGEFHKGRINKTFNVQIPLQKWSQQKKNKTDFPHWWPKTDAFHTSVDVTQQMKDLISTVVFPHLVSNAQDFSMKVGINQDMIFRYLSGIQSGLTQKPQATYEYGFYYPCRNLWLEKYNGPIDYQEYFDEVVIIHRRLWEPDVYEKLKRSAFESSSNLKEVTLW